MSYRLSKSEMRILLETRNESDEVFKRQSSGKPRKNYTVKSLLILVCSLLMFMLFMYGLLWLGTCIGEGIS